MAQETTAPALLLEHWEPTRLNSACHEKGTPMPNPTPEFVTRRYEQCAQFVPHGEKAQHDVATPILALAVRELYGNLCSLREYANDLEERLAKIEPQS